MANSCAQLSKLVSVFEMKLGNLNLTDFNNCVWKVFETDTLCDSRPGEVSVAADKKVVYWVARLTKNKWLNAGAAALWLEMFVFFQMWSVELQSLPLRYYVDSFSRNKWKISGLVLPPAVHQPSLIFYGVFLYCPILCYMTRLILDDFEFLFWRAWFN